MYDEEPEGYTGREPRRETSNEHHREPRREPRRIDEDEN